MTGTNGNEMTNDDIELMIKRHEGFKDRVYRDSLGNLTGGWGHYFEEESRIPESAAQILFNLDFAQARLDYEKLHLDIDPVRRAVMIDMLFNIGLPKLLGFKRMFKAVKAKDYTRAADEMLDSKWAGQVKTRAVRLARMMKTGEA